MNLFEFPPRNQHILAPPRVEAAPSGFVSATSISQSVIQNFACARMYAAQSPTDAMFTLTNLSLLAALAVASAAALGNKRARGIVRWFWGLPGPASTDSSRPRQPRAARRGRAAPPRPAVRRPPRAAAARGLEGKTLLGLTHFRRGTTTKGDRPQVQARGAVARRVPQPPRDRRRPGQARPPGRRSKRVGRGASVETRRRGTAAAATRSMPRSSGASAGTRFARPRSRPR